MCFDRTSHDWLLFHVPMDKAMLQKWLKAEVIPKEGLRPTKSGTLLGPLFSSDTL